MALSMQALTATMVHDAATGGVQLETRKGLTATSRRFCMMHRSLRECSCCGPATPAKGIGFRTSASVVGAMVLETALPETTPTDATAPIAPDLLETAEAVAAELGFADTHCHLEEVLQQVRRHQAAPSLEKDFDELNAEEEGYFRTLGWLWISTSSSASSSGSSNEELGGVPNADTTPKSSDAAMESSSSRSPTWACRWESLRPEEREAAVQLGWSKATWDLNRWHLPRDKPWEELGREMQRCLLVLGESEDSWDHWKTRSATAVSSTSSAQQSWNTSAKEMRTWAELPAKAKDAARGLGFTEGTWDTTEMAELASCRHLFGAGFLGCVTQGCDTESVIYAEELAMKNREVFVSFGCHPKGAVTYTDKFEAQLLAAMKRCGRKAVAWGEFGLDYSHQWFGRHGYNRRTQREVFAKQLKLAIDNGFPLVLHSRAADRDTLRMMRQYVPRNWKVHMHSYRGSVQFLEVMLSDWTECYIGFSGLVTMTDPQVEELCKLCPVEKMLLETDAPYLPLQGTTYSHPGHIPAIAARIAELKGCPVRDVLTAARENAKAMYGI